MQKITPFLWFDHQAEEAANYYVSIFRHSRIVNIARYGEAAAAVSGRPNGSVMTISFELDGQTFTALNGEPEFKFTEAISFVVNCETQDELDDIWSRLTAGGEEVQCGWLKDRYGVSWQVVPAMLDEWINDPDTGKANRVMQALLKMNKLDIAELGRAYRGQ